ncbi:helicase associated domain-containing protein [Glaciihabitans sp. INWT7]|uniref:helicase associated domain-containing protein n=1 Tax=Glaciihabitans sp. INWT7 TaxID=2596912 RepID=UPI00162AA37D|nr:helicase associated domain-containing protein [Glaciihabitans sp. INWT7]
MAIAQSDFNDGMSVEEVSVALRKDRRWKTVFATVKALGLHDEVVKQIIDQAVRRSDTGPGEGGDFDQKVTIDISGDVGERFKVSLKEGLRLAIHREVAGTWNEAYGELAAWLAEHEGVWPSSKKDRSEKERKLGGWVSGQVSLMRKGAMSKERSRYFGELPGWFDRYATANTKNENALEEYIDWTNAHGRPPRHDAADPVEAGLASKRAALSVFVAKFGGVLLGSSDDATPDVR